MNEHTLIVDRMHLNNIKDEIKFLMKMNMLTSSKIQLNQIIIFIFKHFHL